MWLLIAFAALPVIEIALFILVGGWIGLWPTLGLVLLAAFAGTTILRTLGTRVAMNMRSAMSGIRDPSGPIADAAVMMVAAMLLIVPGFLTDVIALALLLPPVRRLILRSVAGRVATGRRDPDATGETRASDVIEGDFTDVTPDPDRKHRPSGWTQH
jgi:UPF0716 protein FxsA